MSWVSLLGDGFCVEATACLSCESCCATAFLFVCRKSFSHVGSHTLVASHTQSQTLHTAMELAFDVMKQTQGGHTHRSRANRHPAHPPPPRARQKRSFF